MNNIQKYGSVLSLTAILTIGSNTNLKFNHSLESAILPNVSVQLGLKANADVTDILNQYLRDSYSDLVGNLFSPWNKQIYMTELSSNEVKNFKNQYRDRANGVMLNAAIERCISEYKYPWWMAARERT